MNKTTKQKLLPDLLISIAIMIFMFIIFALFEITEVWFELTREYEEYELDEASGLILGFFMGTTYLAFRLLSRVQRDSKKIAQLNHSLKNESLTDNLTHLPNRRAFENHINKLIADPDNKNFTLLYIDLDSFKFINDTLGHAVGDLILVQTANRLLQTTNENAFLARIGGDEFCIVIPGYTDNNACLALCSELDNTISKTFSIENHKLHISHTAGISRFPEDGNNFETLLKTAHIAMYMGKTSGHRRSNFKDGNFTNAMEMRFLIQHSLQDAIRHKELYVEYQPKINLLTNELVGAEALVRWNHPEMGFIPPDKFIYIAEETGLVDAIDFYVLETVCQQIKRWGASARPIAVNLSPVLFADENLVNKVFTLLDKYDVPAHLIEFEITERTIVADSDVPLKICNQLTDRGINVSLDDFGTGYSSLSHIADFPISALKIDRAFISQICKNDRTQNIVSAIIHLAKALNIKVIAEGVETDDQRTLAQDLACNEAQGYFFDKPLSKDAFESRLNAQLHTTQLHTTQLHTTQLHTTQLHTTQLINDEELS